MLGPLSLTVCMSPKEYYDDIGQEVLASRRRACAGRVRGGQQTLLGLCPPGLCFVGHNDVYVVNVDAIPRTFVTLTNRRYEDE
jgi:hypothetical protein